MSIPADQMPEVFCQIIAAPANVIRIYKQGCQAAFDSHPEADKKHIQHLHSQLIQLFDFLILQKEIATNQKAV